MLLSDWARVADFYTITFKAGWFSSIGPINIIVNLIDDISPSRNVKMYITKNILFLAFVSLFSSTEVFSSRSIPCGLRPRGTLQLLRRKRDLQPAIIGGKETRTHSIPWQASLRNKASNRHFCGGSVIDDIFIITAAHCVDETALSSVKIVLGDHSISREDSTERTYFPNRFIIHPNYTKDPPENDLALIELTEAIEFSDAISPICLPTARPSSGQSCIVSGWGSTRDQRSIHWEDSSDVLREANVPIRDHETCSNQNHWGPLVTSKMICVGNSHVGTCFGDSGGPLFCNDGGSKNYYYLAGVTSFGDGYKNLETGDAWCSNSETYPDVHTSVESYIAWINSYLQGPRVTDSLVERLMQQMTVLQVGKFI